MENKLSLKSFSSGINKSINESLMKPYEAYNAINCDIGNGSLKTFPVPLIKNTFSDTVKSFIPFYENTYSDLLVLSGTSLYKRHEDYDFFQTLSGRPLDSVNFEYNGQRIAVYTSANDTPRVYDGGNSRLVKNRRKIYDDNGNLTGYADANGTIHSSESDITTYAPLGDFIELHYDRLWISGETTNPDRVYFSTANVNGADIEDWTSPIEEAEANQHGGFIDVRSYDGSKIIGMKVIFNNIVIFKNKSAFKIFGDNPSNYTLVQLFSSNGAIADKSICVGNNGAYFLNSDGIYFYDGTNTILISDKIKDTIQSMNMSYANSSVGIFYNNKYYIAIPTGSSTTNNVLIEYNPVTKSFMLFDVSNIQGFVEYENELLFASNNQVKTMFKGTTSTNLLWESPYIDFGNKNSKKSFSYVYFRGKGNGQIKITMTGTNTKELLVDLTSTEQIYRKKLKCKGRMIKIKFENVNGSNFDISSPEFIYEEDMD